MKKKVADNDSFTPKDVFVLRFSRETDIALGRIHEESKRSLKTLK